MRGHDLQLKKKRKIFDMLSKSKYSLRTDITKQYMNMLYDLVVRVSAIESRELLIYFLENEVNHYTDSFSFLFLLYISN
jgi:hypothetical protein